MMGNAREGCFLTTTTIQLRSRKLQFVLQTQKYKINLSADCHKRQITPKLCIEINFILTYHLHKQAIYNDYLNFKKSIKVHFKMVKTRRLLVQYHIEQVKAYQNTLYNISFAECFKQVPRERH